MYDSNVTILYGDWLKVGHVRVVLFELTDKQVENNVGDDDVEGAEVDERSPIVATVRLPVVAAASAERRRHLANQNTTNQSKSFFIITGLREIGLHVGSNQNYCTVAKVRTVEIWKVAKNI